MLIPLWCSVTPLWCSILTNEVPPFSPHPMYSVFTHPTYSVLTTSMYSVLTPSQFLCSHSLTHIKVLRAHPIQGTLCLPYFKYSVLTEYRYSVLTE